MQIINDINLTVGLGQNSSAKTIGMVLKTPEDTGIPGQLGLLIPKFMVGYDLRDGFKGEEKSIPLKNSKCVNSKNSKTFLSNSVMMKNYITVRPLLNQNQDIAKYVVGDKVFVEIIDDDIKSMVYLPYSFNKLGQRATDSMRILVPANKNINTELTDENTYYVVLDSQSKKLELSTSKANGEVCLQTITLDSKEGLITITDNKDLTYTMNTQEDQIQVSTSGSTLTMKGDQVTLDADSITLNGSSNIKFVTETMEIEADTIKSTASDVNYEYDNFKQTSQSGEYSVSTEKHTGNATSFSGATFHVDMPVIGLNGAVVFPSFSIGAVPNINSVPPPTGGSLINGTMMFQTDPAGMPLAKAPPLIACLTAIAAAADAFPSGCGAASAAVASMAASLSTTKMLSS